MSNLLSLGWRAAKSSGIKDKRQCRPSKAQHTTGAAAGELQLPPPPKPWGCLSFQGLKDYTGQLWGSVTGTEISLGCQLSTLCPCCDTLSAQQRPPLPLISAGIFFLQKLSFLVLLPWPKNWNRSLNMTVFRFGKQQGSIHFAFLTFRR